MGGPQCVITRALVTHAKRLESDRRLDGGTDGTEL